MKKVMFALLATVAIAFTACNGSAKTEDTATSTDSTKVDSVTVSVDSIKVDSAFVAPTK
jgi:hypothetical protein